MIEENSVVGDRLRILHEVVSQVENSLRTFGRRNLPLRPFLAKLHPAGDPKLDGMLPLYLAKDDGHEHWLYTAEELEAYRQQRNPSAPAAPEASVAEVEAVADDVTELHEVRSLNKALARLREEFGLRGMC